MNGHLTILYGQNAFPFICLVDMEHGAVRIKLCGVGAILQNALCLGFGLAAGLRLSLRYHLGNSCLGFGLCCHCHRSCHHGSSTDQ